MNYNVRRMGLELEGRMRKGNASDTRLRKEYFRLTHNYDTLLKRGHDIETSQDTSVVKYRKELEKFKSKLDKLIQETTYESE